MSNLLPRGTKVTIKAGYHTGKTGHIYNVFTDEPVYVYDVMVDKIDEIWEYAHTEVKPIEVTKSSSCGCGSDRVM